MSNNKASKLRQSILTLNTQLLKLRPKLEESEEANLQYNKIVLKKAIIKKELDRINQPILGRIFKVFKPKNEKLICDYFKS